MPKHFRIFGSTTSKENGPRGELIYLVVKSPFLCFTYLAKYWQKIGHCGYSEYSEYCVSSRIRDSYFST